MNAADTTTGAPEFRAAGTDLSERRRSGVARGALADIATTPALRAIEWRADGAAGIGALVTVAEIARDGRIAAAYPGLAAAAAGLATPQIRTLATIGGNLAQRTRCWYYRNPGIACLKKGGSGCPSRGGNHRYGVAFDLGACVAPHPSTLGAALLAYDAIIATSQRPSLGIAELFGDGRAGTEDNTLRAGELIERIVLPPPLPGERASYGRAISRAHAEWPLAEVIARGVIEDGRFARVAVAAGGIAPVPLRLAAVEAALSGRAPDAGTIAAAAQLAVTDANPLPQTGYKLDLLVAQVADALTRIAGRDPRAA